MRISADDVAEVCLVVIMVCFAVAMLSGTVALIYLAIKLAMSGGCP